MLVKHGSMYLLAKVIPAILSLATLTIFTRMLSPSEYGLYSLTVLVSGMVNAVLLQWIVLGVGRYLPDCKSRYEADRLLSTARSLSALVALIILCFVVSTFKIVESDEYVFAYVVAGFMCSAQAFYDLNLKVQNANLNPINYAKLLAIKSLLAFSLGVLAIYFGFGAEGALIAVVVSFAIPSLVGYRSWSGVPCFTLDREVMLLFFRYGAPLTIAFFLVYIINSSGRFFIERMMGLDAVGVYSAAYELAQYSIGAMTTVVHLAAFPLIVAGLSKNGVEYAKVQLRKSFIAILSITMPAAVGLAIISPNIAKALMGAGFGEAEYIIPWFALGVFLNALKAFYFDYSFQLASAMRPYLITVAAPAILNIVLNFHLIPVYGLEGAAISMAAAFAVGLVLSMALGRKFFEMPIIWWSEVFKVCIATGAMFILVNFSSFNDELTGLILKILVGGGGYLMFLFLFNFIGGRDSFLRFLNKLAS